MSLAKVVCGHGRCGGTPSSSPSSEPPQSPHPSTGVQRTGGNRQIRTTIPPLARGGTPVVPGAKLFQNLRSTRETELAEDFPMHVVCQWIGNSQPIAAKHYLPVTDDHFSRALQKALQQPAVLPRTGSQAALTAQEKTPVLQGFASECDVVRAAGVPPQGLEP